MKQHTQKTILSAVFIALGIILPFFTGQIPSIGNKLLPMHLPILICGLICGWQYGLIAGLITPLLRSVLFGMPMLFPMAISMAFELATYGAVCGFLYNVLSDVKGRVFIALISAMIAGRLVWGVVSIVLFGIAGNPFSMQMFMGMAVLNAIPGIALQLVIVPIIITAVERGRRIQYA